jgi:hypothetical protein
MGSLRDIQNAIETLTAEERDELLRWLLEADRQIWDEQIRRDFSASGAGIKLLEEVDAQIRRGKFGPLE